MIQMYQKITHLRILSVFLDNPYEGYYIREAARVTGLSPMTVKRTFDELEGEGLITRERTKGRVLFRGNMESPTFRFLKISHTISKIEASDILKAIGCMVNGITSIILYGSAARGDDALGSDIDLLIISSNKREIPDLRRFERNIGRPISLKIFTPADWDRQVIKNKAFYINVITEGIVLQGRRPVVT